MHTINSLSTDSQMQQKICLVTGATSGVGLETARGLADMGARVFIHGRDPRKLELTLEDITRSTANTNLVPILGDVSSLAQVREMAEEVRKHTSKLDVLINNAGAVNMTRQLSPDGIELTFAANHLAYFLLTFCLMDMLLSNAPARIIVVSSFAHGYVGTEAVDDYMFEQNYQGWQAYSRSKLCNLYFTYELARRLEGTSLTVNALHPGFVNTGIGKNNTPQELATTPLKKPGIMTNEEGARTSLYCAVAPELEKVSGKYFDKCLAVPSSEVSYDLAAAQRLWKLSAQLTGEDPDLISKLRNTSS